MTPPVSLADVLEARDDDAHDRRDLHRDRRRSPGPSCASQAEALAAALRAAGLRPGQAVGVMLPNGADIVAALFGVWFAGGVYVPLNPRLSPDELAHVIAEDRPAADRHPSRRRGRVADVPVVPRPATAPGTVARAGRRRRAARRRPTSPPSRSRRARPGDRSRCCSCTTTCSGCIDGVLAKLRGGGAARAAPSAAPMPNLIPTSLSLWAGIYNVLFAFRVGAAVIIMDRFDTRAFAGFVERFQLRSTVLPPAAMTMLADDESITSLAPLKYVRSITAPLSPLQARRFRDRFGITVLNGWGQTEIGGEIVGWSAAGRQGVRRHASRRGGSRRTRTSSLRIGDDGEILVQTPTIVAARRRRRRLRRPRWSTAGSAPATSAASTREGFLWIEGRVSDMINRGGLKVFPEEVAEVIRLSPDVAECAVAGIPDDRLGEVPWAFVVPRPGATVDADALAALCREHLAPYKVPVRFEPLDALPRNEVGKVLAARAGGDVAGESQEVRRREARRRRLRVTRLLAVGRWRQTHDRSAGEFGLNFCSDTQAELSHVSGPASLRDVRQWQLGDFRTYPATKIGVPDDRWTGAQGHALA